MAKPPVPAVAKVLTMLSYQGMPATRRMRIWARVMTQ